MSEFDSDVNTTFHVNKQDTVTDAVSLITGGVTATVVDMGASFWNSLPGTAEVETADLLSRVSNNALQVYNEHPDAVQAASFIAGSFLPAGLALKGMTALRAGSKAVNWFNAAGKAEDSAKVATMFAEGLGGTAAYRGAVRGLYARTAVNQVIDAAAMEVAVLGMLNSSPLVEDYMKDPVQNFGISLALGGIIGGGIGVAADHFAVRSLSGKLTEDALTFLKAGTTSVPPNATNAIAIQALGKNVEFYDTIIANGKAIGKTAENDLTISYASKLRETYSTDIEARFVGTVSDDLLKRLAPAQREELKAFIVSGTEMHGVDSIRLVNQKDLVSESVILKPKSGIADEPTLLKVENSKLGPTQPKQVQAVYFQDMGMYGTVADLKTYANAASLEQTPAQLAKSLQGKSFGKIGDFDSALDLMVKSSAQIQGDLIGHIAKVDSLSLSDWAKLKVAPSHQSMLEAIAAKMTKDAAFETVGVKLASQESYNIALAAEKLISPESYKFADKVHIGKFDPASFPNGVPGKSSDVTLSSDILNILLNWRGAGGMHDFRLGAAEYNRGGYTAVRAGNQTKEAKLLQQKFTAVMNSPGSEALRAEFTKAADSEGYVYLWRGSRNLKDRSAVRSYSTDKDKALEFGAARLYKIHPDDIVAGFNDTGDVEILVMEGIREHISLSTKGKAVLGNMVQPEGATVHLPEILKLIRENKVSEIDALLQNGIPLQGIAIKTNTPYDVVMEYAATKNFTAAVDSYSFRTGKDGISTIRNLEGAEAALSPTNAPLLLTGNSRKQSYTQAIAAGNDKMMKDMNSEITAAAMYASGNPHVKELADFFMRPSAEGGNRALLDMLYDRISKANNAYAGNFFIQSADFAMRNMGDLGPMVSFVGKEVQKIANRMIDTINIPLASALTRISKSAVETVEFNTFREVNAGIAGWRVFKDGKLWVNVVDDGGKILKNDLGENALKAVTFQGKDYEVVSDSVKAAIVEMQDKSTLLLSLTNTGRRIQGLPNVQDIGLWVPSFNPVNKHVAYVHDALDDKTSIIWANNAAELEQLSKSYKESIVAQGKEATVKVYQKGDEQGNWSRMNGRLDVMTMKVADSSMKKSGSSGSALVRTDVQVFDEIASGYEHYVNSQMRNLADLTMSDITHELDMMSRLNKYGFSSQPLTQGAKITQAPKDAAAKVKNLLLGDSNLGEYEGWKSVNTSFENVLTMASNAVAGIWDATTSPLKKTFLGGKKSLTTESMQKFDYEKFSKELEKAGVVNPWAVFDKEAARMYGLSSLEDSADTSRRIVFASNALAATMMLRVGELAQPLVNMMSLPILTALASANKMPESFMGVQKGLAKVSLPQVIFDGGRAVNDPAYKALGDMWEKAGYFTPIVSEANNTLRAARSTNKGIISAVEKALDSSIVNFMSKPADASEGLVRRITMFTGAALGKRLYPELDDLGVTVFARDFMDKAVGNFHASQRPVFFQGTLGVALGLFQTYSLTLGQSIYRHLELKNYKALGVAALAQSTIFGAGSMPGFHAVSNMIGEHFSDSHMDLTTGTYRAVGDEAAKTILYGLPSLAGLGTHTRGDSNFRIPGITGDNVVAINFAKQATQAIGTVSDSFGQGSNAKQAFLEALSLQSMSRPLARGAELASGYSITRAGNTVQTPEEVWTTQGIMARVIGTRPIAEIKLREADQLNRFYGSIDRDNRQEVIKEIRTALRDSDLSSEKVSKAAEKYFRNNGTPAGWRSALATAIGKTETSGKEIFTEKLKPDSPLQYMINNNL